MLIAYCSFLLVLSLISLENFQPKKSFILLIEQLNFKNPILTALYQWMKDLTKMSVFFSPKEYHDISTEVLQSRFASAKTVPETQKPCSNFIFRINSDVEEIFILITIFPKKLKRTKKSSVQ